MKNLLLLTFLVSLLFSCGKGPETVTVTSDPLEPTQRTDTTSDFSGADNEEEFRHLRIAELSAIESLDPLFAESNSELRVINLVFDGLARLDESGNPEPALAKDWEVNRDSTRYTFHLRTDISFHNVDAFSGRRGRGFNASDVRFVFERMASSNVPSYASEIFNDIRGFNSYHSEQLYVKNPDKRALDTISGIDVQNDSTIVFTLKESTSDFLKKLTHPIASVYARESSESVNPIQKPAGTGAFYLVAQEDDRHIFGVNKNYHGEIPSLHRLDVISDVAEENLLQMLSNRDIDILIELNPSTFSETIDSAGNLVGEFSTNFKLEQPQLNSTYSLYFNEESGQEEAVSEIFSTLEFDEIIDNQMLGKLSFHQVDTANTGDVNNGQLVFSQTEHPAEVYLINRLLEQVTAQGYTASMHPSYAITEEITFSTRNFPNTTEILSWDFPLYILMRDTISNIEVNHQPWNLSLTNISVSEEI